MENEENLWKFFDRYIPLNSEMKKGTIRDIPRNKIIILKMEKYGNEMPNCVQCVCVCVGECARSENKVK